MKKLLAIAIALVTVIMMAVPVLASVPGDHGTASMNATVGAGSPPYVCAKFETPDHSTTPGTQILPVAAGDRIVKFYVVTGHPNGDTGLIVRVDVTVRYPDGTEKFQLTAIKDANGNWSAQDNSGNPVAVRLVPWSDTGFQIDTDADCTPDTSITTAMTSLDAQSRIAYGKDGQGNQYKLSSVLYDLKMGKQIMLEFVGKMGSHQPAVTYTVEAVSTDNIGSTGEKTINTFDYLSIVALNMDFTTVNFGNIKAGQSNRVLGDTDPLTANRPSVKNEGNDPGMIQLCYTKMVNAEGKFISDFDGRLGASTYWTLMKANTPTILLDADGDPTLLPPCTWTQLDLSVEPPIGTMGGAYTGSVTVTILHYID